MSLPSAAEANSFAITSTVQEEMSNSSDLNLDTAAKSLFNWNEESLKVSSVQFTPIKRNVSQVVSQQQAKDKLDYEIKVNKPELDEFTEIQFVNDETKSTIVKHENSSRRRSISDLVERFRKVLEASNSITAKLENKCIEHEIE